MNSSAGSTPGTGLRLVRTLYVLLMVGFGLGTLVLLGPVRWVTEALRGAGWSPEAENVVVVGMILIYLGISATLAVSLAWSSSPHGRRWRRNSPVWTTAVALATLLVWFNPDLIVGADREAAPEILQAGEVRFVFGPYPGDDDLGRLKREGYTGVISLLHPAVVPFEPKLLKQERDAARKAGIPVISLPMLPWVGDNGASLDSLRAIARGGSGRYYVHCYLGRDRVNVALRAITSVSDELLEGEVRAPKDIRQKGQFERGEIVLLEHDVFLTPFPTDEEFFFYIAAGGIRTVVSLLDPAVESNTRWIEKEERILEENQITLVSLPLDRSSYDPDRVLEIARQVKALPRPVLVHAFRGRSQETAAFRSAYEADLPPVLADRIVRGVGGGEPVVVAPNLVVGPRPTPREFGTALKRSGVKEVVYAGPRNAAVSPDAEFAAEAGLSWTVVSGGDSLSTRGFSSGGPWYVYGPDSWALR